jgi:tetratricopeptide (TPR) repeat protein
MITRKHKVGQRILAFCTSLALLFQVWGPVWGQGSTDLLRLRRGVHATPTGSYTRLVFDFQGERPARIDDSDPNKLVIEFHQLNFRVEQEIPIPSSLSPVTSVQRLETNSRPVIQINYRTAGSSFKHAFLPAEPPRSDQYRMMVEVFPPVPGSKPAAEGKVQAQEKKNDTAAKLPVEKESKKPPPKVESMTPLPPPPSLQDLEPSEALQKAQQFLTRGSYNLAYQEFDKLFLNPPRKEELPLILYGLADSYYFMHQNDLDKVAPEIIAYYAPALKKDPTAKQAPWAWYRTGQAYELLDEIQKATESYQKVIQEYPKTPAAPFAYLALAVLYQEQSAHLDAIRAARSALEFPLEQSDAAQAHYLLGSSLFASGDYAAAVAPLEQALKADPSLGHTHPAVLRQLGESCFMIKQLKESRDYLLHYLNIEQDLQQKDIILAKIAETFLVQDEQILAGKLHEYIRSQFPDSEGDIIGQIRRMEYLRSKGKLDSAEELRMYEELIQKPLPPSLLRIVQGRYAQRLADTGQYDQSLAWIDRIIADEKDRSVLEQFRVMRGEVIVSYLRDAYEKKDFKTVVQVYEPNATYIPDVTSGDLAMLLAESYAKLKFFPIAAAMCEKGMLKDGANRDEGKAMKLAQYSFQAGDVDRALILCQQIGAPALEVDKARLLAQIYYSQHSYARVVETLNPLIHKGLLPKDEFRLYEVYSESLFHLGECEKALPWLEKAILQRTRDKTAPAEGLIEYYLFQSTCLRKLNHYEKAIAVLEHAGSVTSSEDQRDQLTYEIAKLHLELGQSDKALDYLKRLMGSSQTFWQTAARQQMDYIQMRKQ